MSALTTLETLTSRKEKERSIVERLAKLKPYAYYEPMPHQEKAHASPRKIRGVFGGNKGGKTIWDVMEFIWCAFGCYPDYCPISRRRSGNQIIRVIGTDFKKGLGTVFIPKLFEWLGVEGQTHITEKRKNSDGVIERLEFDGGKARADFMSSEQDIKFFEGWDGDLVIIDEPTRQDIYYASLRGLTARGGRMIISATLLYEPWMFTELYLSSDPDIEIFGKNDEWQIYSNTYISREEIEIFRRKLPPEEEQVRIFGRPKLLAGLIWGELDKEIHLVPHFNLSNVACTRYMVIDPHDSKPSYLLWLAVFPDGKKFVYRGMVLSKTVKGICETIREVEATAKERIQERFVDPSSMNKKKIIDEEYSIWKAFQDEGYTLTLANNDMQVGRDAVRQELKDQSLFFLDSLHPEVWKQLSIYSYEMEEKHNDFPDCLRYMIVAKPKYVSPVDFLRGQAEEMVDFAKRGITGYGLAEVSNQVREYHFD